MDTVTTTRPGQIGHAADIATKAESLIRAMQAALADRSAFPIGADRTELAGILDHAKDLADEIADFRAEVGR